MDTQLFHLDPIKQFLKAIGKDVEKYFGKDPSCIVYLKPDGTFYGVALYEWLKKKKKNLTITTMEDDGAGLEEGKVQGRKVLIVDNDIITGKGYKRSMEAIRERKERLQIKDIKFAVLVDRVGLADFSAGEYSTGTLWHAGDLDAIDLKIISYLGENGRESLAEIAKKTKLSAVAVKNRLDQLIKNKILHIQGLVNIERFYTLSALVLVSARKKAIDVIIEKCRNKTNICYLARGTGKYNLAIALLAHTLEDIEEFVERELRDIEGVEYLNVGIGEVPIIPSAVAPKLDFSLPRLRTL